MKSCIDRGCLLKGSLSGLSRATKHHLLYVFRGILSFFNSQCPIITVLLYVYDDAYFGPICFSFR
jgi:hypothetical protein